MYHPCKHFLKSAGGHTPCVFVMEPTHPSNERQSIFVFKTSRNTTETYSMLKTTFGDERLSTSHERIRGA